MIAYGGDGRVLDISDKAGGAGELKWTAPAGAWEVVCVSRRAKVHHVEYAPPGGEGHALDHFSERALKKYVARYSEAFAGCRKGLVRSFFNDSYEMSSNWTYDMFEQFEKRRGYDLRGHLRELMGKGDAETVARVKSDYRETISDLILERFTIPWARWCNSQGSMARNQAHGSPGNLIDLYGASDIAETEIFWPSCFEIPGVRTDKYFPQEKKPYTPNIVTMKFASSGAHLTGRKLTSSESCTWLGEHFRVALSQIKPEVDQLMAAGINHIFYHGTTYSPAGEQWPGWFFYAATHFNPVNTWWKDVGQLNNYIARCQSFLQEGGSDEDVLLYWPLYDIWHNKERGIRGFWVQGSYNWMRGTDCYDAANMMLARGYCFDYVSDRLIGGLDNSGGEVGSRGVNYKVIVIPKCDHLPVGTLEGLVELAEGGATVIFNKSLPEDVPGYGNLDARRRKFKGTLSKLNFKQTGRDGVRRASVGKGQILSGDDLAGMLDAAGVRREEMADKGLKFVRRTHGQGHHYFITNLGTEGVDGWVKLGVKAKSAVMFDALTGRRGAAKTRGGDDGAIEVYVQLLPGQSRILRTFEVKKIDGEKWRYLKESGEGYEIKGMWRAEFVEGGPELAPGFETRELSSWTKIGGVAAKAFSGTVRYTIGFNKPREKAEGWILDLGRVCESARVKINGRDVGVLWSVPFRMEVGEYLRDGENTLEVEVTNLMANRVADMYRRKVPQKEYYYTRFVNIIYKPFDASGWEPMESGLLGPVRLIPAALLEGAM